MARQDQQSAPQNGGHEGTKREALPTPAKKTTTTKTGRRPANLNEVQIHSR